MKVEVRKVKSFRGREGLGFNAELVVDGKKVAFVIDEGSGGALRFDWEGGRDSPAQKKLLLWLASQTPEALGLHINVPGTDPDVAAEVLFRTPEDKLDAYVNHLVDLHEEAKRLARQKKTKVVIEDQGKRYTFNINRGETREQTEAEVRCRWPSAKIL